MPTAEIAVMGAEGAVNIVYRGKSGAPPIQEATRKEKIAEFRDGSRRPCSGERDSSTT